MLNSLKDEQRDNLALIGSLMGGIVHNINTPLAAVVNRSEMIQLRIQKLQESYQAHSDSVIEEGNKILRDISAILENTDRVSEILTNVVKKSINEKSQNIQKINLSSLFKEELSFFLADMTMKHQIEKVYHLNENIPCIQGIYSHFSHSFFQIIDNSKKAMEKTDVKKLTVYVECDGKDIITRFHDTGCGILPEKTEIIKEYLNDLLLQDPVEQGLGRGLFLVKVLLNFYNPKFDITSSPGNTTFSIHFPLC